MAQLEQLSIGDLKAYLNCNYTDEYAWPLYSVSEPVTLIVNGNEATVLEIPEGVSQIGDFAFFHCKSITDLKIPEGVLRIGCNAFCDCTNLVEVSMPASLKTIGDGAFANTDNIRRVSIASIESWLNLSFENEYDTWSLPNWINGSNIKDMRLYLNGQELTEIQIPGSIKTIRRNAFENFDRISRVVINEGVARIEENAFAHMSGLKTLSLPASIQSIAPTAFWSSLEIDSLLLSDLTAYLTSMPAENDNYHGILGENGQVWLNGKELFDLIIPEGFTRVPANAFYNWTNLRTISMPNTLQTIGTNAFYHCSSVSKIVIPGGVTSIGNSAFSRCNGLQELSLPASLTSVGSHCFGGSVSRLDLESLEAYLNCSYGTNSAPLEGGTSGRAIYVNGELLTQVIIPDTVQKVPPHAFDNCRDITEVIFAGPTTEIDEYAFFFCSGLKTIELPAGLQTIRKLAFAYSGLESVYIPDSTTKIEHQVFSQCEKLSRVSLPASVVIDQNAFPGSYTPLEVDYHGDRIDAANLLVLGPWNEALTNPDAVWHYRPNGKCGEDLTWVIDDSGTLIISGTGEMTAYTASLQPWDPKAFSRVRIEEGVTTISDYAFYNAPVDIIQLPESMETFGVHIVTSHPIVLCPEFSNADYWAYSNQFETVYSDQLDMDPFFREHGNIELFSDTTLYRGTVHRITACVFPLEANELLKWTSSDPTVAEVDQNGQVTAVNHGRAVITAEYAGVSDCVTVTVNNFEDVGVIHMDETPEFLRLGETLQLSFRTVPQDNSLTFTYTSTDSSVLDVDANGKVTAVGHGYACVWVEAEGVTAATGPIYVYTPITDVTLPEEFWGVAKSFTQIHWDIEPANANPLWIWTSEHSAHAAVTVSEDGLVSCFVPGDITITMTDRITGLSASTLVHVCRPVTSIEMPEELTFAECTRSYQFESVAVTMNARYINHLIVYTSDDNNVATVTDDGLMTIVGPGTVNITTRAESGVSASCKVTILPEHDRKTTTPAVLPTCVDTGNTEYFTCDDCGAFFGLVNDEYVSIEENSWIVPAINHQHWEKADVTAVEPTCTEDGCMEYAVCDDCGAYLLVEDETVTVIEENSWIIPAPGHTEVVDEAIAPTCTETGLTEGSHCTACQEVFVAQEILPATHRHVMQSGACCTCGRSFDTTGAKVLTLPSLLTSIADNAFEGIFAEIVVIPAGCTKIGERAFADCAALRYVFMPADIDIHDSAFDGCENTIEFIIQ